MTTSSDELRNAKRRCQELVDATFFKHAMDESFIADLRLLLMAVTVSPADADHEIDADWLQRISDPRTRNVVLNSYGFVGGGITLVIERDARNRWLGELRQDDQRISVGELKTRADVRNLCRVLNIELKEQP